MIKKLILLAMAVSALVAFAAPGMASANWTKNGEPITENGLIHFVGSTSFTSGAGTTTCPESTALIEATAGTTTGHVLVFSVNTSTCTVGGFLGSVCGEHSLASSELEEGATGTISGGTIGIEGIDLTNHYEPCGIELTLTGGITATPAAGGSLDTITLSGSLASSLGGTVSLSGTLTNTEKGVWGIE